MPADFDPRDDLQSVWQSQQAEGIQMSIEEIRQKAKKLHQRVLRRNLREHLAALIIVAFLGFHFWRSTDALMRTGFGLIVAGTLYVAWHLYRRGSSRSLPAEMGLASGFEFLKRELERQRDLLSTVARWYLGPLLPGWTVSSVAIARANPSHSPHFALYWTAYNIAALAFFFYVWKLNQRAARKLQRQIDTLNAQGGL